MKYQKRTIALIGEEQRKLAIAAVQNAPIGMNVEMVLQETPKGRTLDQQAKLFAGPMKDIAEQAWLQNRQFSVEIWHEHCKREYLPEDNDPYLFELVKDCDKYHKWDFNPRGERVLVGSTTQLTKYGYSLYLEQVYAFGANLGVLFKTNAKELQ